MTIYKSLVERGSPFFFREYTSQTFKVPLYGFYRLKFDGTGVLQWLVSTLLYTRSPSALAHVRVSSVESTVNTFEFWENFMLCLRVVILNSTETTKVDRGKHFEVINLNL